MAIVKKRGDVVTPNGVIQRRIEERTSQIIILTPLHEDGIEKYSAVAYREWVEYENDVPIKITRLPPLKIPLTPQMLPFMKAIAGRIDLISTRCTSDGTWPVIDRVQLKPEFTPPPEPGRADGPGP